MGGRALKSVETRRYNRDEFEDISKEVTTILLKTFKNVGVPRFFKSKETFGDLDVVISPIANISLKNEVEDYINETFNPGEIFINTNMFSFDYKELQVDLIFMADEDFQPALNYFSDNDLGNYIGNIAKSIGFKYGQEGLWFNYSDSTGAKNKIILCQDQERIFNFLDLD
jgi:DNA polymerase/3'-5' exonuclease PolX